MTTPDCWKLIADAAREAAEPEEIPEALTALLAKLPPEQIVGFDRWFHERLDEAYTWDLWAAAYVMMGGCGDDGFEYFRCWLIAQGRETFGAVVANPDSLAELEIEDPYECELEGLLAATMDAFEERAGEELPALPPELRLCADPVGTPFDEDSEEDMRGRCPRLFEKYWAEAE
ncbi:MAG: DUF4240 domain-containing protein [Phycisphaerales bacterium]|nr:DUF4240 domain-containing protein [Phycisphaerales bacterium]